ncbi:MAG: HsdR family type I site-specific deoxyribonuclease [Planctomycetota bacterium]
MSNVGQPERATQRRLVKLFRDELGYRDRGDWSDRANNNIEEEMLVPWLAKRGHDHEQITRAVHKLRAEASNHGRSLYANNQAVWSLLRYGANVQTEIGARTENVFLVDWRHPEKNDFAIAEEVTLSGERERRPDLVLYLNGIAIAVIELKNSRISIGEGIRQLLSNQQPQFHAWFFSTVQFAFAGNDSEGLKYGTIGTPEKMFLRWKEDEQDDSRSKLDKYLLKMCRKERLLELIHDFVLFDGGVKKLPRAHQYFGVKAAQEQVRRRQGGVIWHTQGSGKSIVMVLLARWILEHNPTARVAVITDRDELDKQIEGIFRDAGESIERTSSGRDLMRLLGQAKPRLLCSLVHKFGRRGDDLDAFLADLRTQPSPTAGEVFVFVDECHRTQSGKLHRVMKAMMPNAVFVGFTGTPLLATDKQTSLEVFGAYIHTYKMKEAVADKVVLDLQYEARDIEQWLGSEERIDAWFEAKTRGLNEWQKNELRGKWGTMQNVLSAKARMDRVVSDIVFDFSVKPRLASERGNAILVASSIYEACKYFVLFQKTPLRGKSAVVTSYDPQSRDVTKEEIGANTETDKQFVYNTYVELLKDVRRRPGKTATEVYEDEVKAKFVEQPAAMKLLVVVDKLLTGFDAPSCTYLYIDKSMQDHGLFQAICRTNRLDGDDKQFGHVVDYKDLFRKVENAIAVYSSELDHDPGDDDPQVLLQDRLAAGKARLDGAVEALELLCEGVVPPEGELEHIRFFCGNVEIPEDLARHEPQRVTLYQAVAALMRAYAGIADDLVLAGYSEADVARIKQRLQHFVDVREIVRRASGETLDLKPYEADMRHLLDTYIEAAEPRKISPFDGMGLMDLIEKAGLDRAIENLPASLRRNETAVAEVIANNIRSRIEREHLNDPTYFSRMSQLLQEVIEDLRARRLDYATYLRRIAEIAQQVQDGHDRRAGDRLPTPGVRAIFSNLQPATDTLATGFAAGEGSESEGFAKRVALAQRIDTAIRQVRPDNWRGHQAKENEIKRALLPLLDGNEEEVERIFKIVWNQGEY